jgi:hypothetical protein
MADPIYHSSHYNTLNHIQEAQHINFDRFQSLRKQLPSHKIGICRLHSHFKLEHGERIVTKQTERGYLASVEIEESTYPWQWRYFENDWIPIEFYQGPAADDATIEQLLSFQSTMQAYF